MNTDVIIIGGNYSGLSLAASLGSEGLRVLVLERGPKRRARFDGRTLALSFRSMKVLDKAGVAVDLKRSACPILDIRVADQDSNAHLDFHHADVGDDPFGWIVENHLFHHALEARIAKLPQVSIISDAQIEAFAFGRDRASVTLKDGRVFRADLIVGADGRNSACRKAADIKTYGWDYHQTALACVIRHEEPHQNVAVEHFQAGGPFASLPMTDAEIGTGSQRSARGKSLRPYRSSIIWTEKTAAADALIKMDDKAFTRAMDLKVGSWLGSTELAGKRFSYPISLQHAERYTGVRLALIGDAAHSIHPIAGQGFNLGMGDIAVLTEELGRSARLGLDCGSPDLLKRFERRRKFDNGNMVLMTDGLTRLFSNAAPPLASARRLGLTAVQHMPALKRFFMRTAMGLGAGGLERRP